MCQIRQCIFLLLSCLSVSLSSQEQMVVFFSQSGEILTSIHVNQGQTMFGIAQKTGNNVSILKQINNKSNHHLSLGETLLAPINKQLQTERPGHHDSGTQLIYNVKKGDNLFKISQLTGVSLSELLHINHKSSNDLAVGEQLSLGWISPENDETIFTQREHVASVPLLPISQISFNNLTRLDRVIDIPVLPAPINAAPPEIVKEKGIAYWEKRDYVGQDLIVMHPRARLNSSISLYNPMLNRTVRAKVVRELPKEAYPEDISVVISPSVASALGALDKRFLVEITYVE